MPSYGMHISTMLSSTSVVATVPRKFELASSAVPPSCLLIEANESPTMIE